MARLLAGDLRLQLESVEIGQVTRDVATRFYPRIRSKSQSLIVELPDSLPPVTADRQYLEEILLSLVANASKFTPEKGKIKVGARQDGESLVVQVSDTGVGIPAEEQERIFQPYYQVNRDGKEKKAGSGLGLAITKSLVELHEGKIWLESIVGQGSTFAFSLPVA
ncbi:sensor histidine kinase [Chloroflexota bacterium]